MAQRIRIRRKVRRSAPRVRRAAGFIAPAAREARHDQAPAGGVMIGGVQDPAEKAADRAADRVMRTTGPAPVVHRICDECAEEEKKAKRQPAQEEDETVERQSAEEEEGEVQTKAVPGAAPVAPGTASAAASAGQAKAIGSLGAGRPLASAERAFFEPRFGTDLSPVRVHDGIAADRASRAIHARAFALGNDVAFARSAYAPGTSDGRRLMAHELAHVVGDGPARRSVRRAWTPDTGWRYTPPASVTRSIEEIQAVVGTTPDGIYGPNTRDAVRKYQNRLKTRGLFSGTPDGRWDSTTDLAHVQFSTGDESETYNCSGLAFKTHTFMGRAATEATLATGTRLSDCNDDCTPRHYKFWMWTYDVSITNLTTGGTTSAHRDFHIVGGQTDGDGKGPSAVVSKNGARPVKGPGAPMSWLPVTAIARTNDKNDTPLPNFRKNRTNHDQRCFCLGRLP